LPEWPSSGRRERASVGQEVKERDPSCTALGIEIGAATVEDDMKVPQKN